MIYASYVRYRYAALLMRLISLYLWNPQRVPGSLWTRKRS